jgi:hypothetical protein
LSTFATNPEGFSGLFGRGIEAIEAYARVSGSIPPDTDVARHGGEQVGNAKASVAGRTRRELASRVSTGHVVMLLAARAVHSAVRARGYAWLFKALGVRFGEPPPPIVVATTNYDAILEQVVASLGGLPDWGQPPAVDSSAETPLDVRHLISGIPRYVPVLHLHGRVGWYRRTSGPYAAVITRHSEHFGIPIVMLPDPEKDYVAEAIINAIWGHFEEALQRARRVFILGHSLNDPALVDALVRNVEPHDRIGVSVLADEDGSLTGDAFDVMKVMERSLGNASVIPMRFGATEAGLQGIAKWIDKT